MQLKRIVIGLLIVLLGAPLGAQDSTSFVDDPVAAMLDSLMRNSYVNRIPKQTTQRTNKYNFAPDSVPVYDPLVIEGRLAKLNSQSPFDLVYNNEVQAYINMYTKKRRGSVERMLGLSQLYYPIFEEQLDKYNLPLELKHLAVIESALNPTATSRAGARGLWQFMYTTGKMYGLEVTSYVDERCDPYQSTIAACEYLQFLYGMFGDWQIVLAAYNAGPGTINKAIRRAGGGKKTYWEIRPFLPKETQAYVPAFIAANYVMTFHVEHNLYAVAPRKVFYDVDTVTVKQQVTFVQLQSVLGIAYDEVQFLNPMYKLGVIPVSFHEPYKLVLPIAHAGNFVQNENSIYDHVKRDSTTAIIVQQKKSIHSVKQGETINSIAKRYKCSVTDVRSWNNLKSNYLKVGQKLTIYTPVHAPSPTSQQSPVVKQPSPSDPNQNKTPVSTTGQYKYYTVKTGDNLWKIAQATGTSVDELKKLNGFGEKIVLKTGQQIKVKQL